MTGVPWQDKRAGWPKGSASPCPQDAPSGALPPGYHPLLIRAAWGPFGTRSRDTHLLPWENGYCHIIMTWASAGLVSPFAGSYAVSSPFLCPSQEAGYDL